MDLMKLIQRTIIIFLVAMLTYCSCLEDSPCTSGFLDPLDEANYAEHTPIPLLGGEGPEQWVFPHMRFTCHGLLNSWIFRGFGREDDELQLTTWRRDPLINTYRRISRTNSTTANVTVSENGTIFIYELNTPLEVQPWDFVGLEVVARNPQSNKNILSLDTSEKGSNHLSYMRPFRFNLGFLLRDIYEQPRAALINVVVGTVISTVAPTTLNDDDHARNTVATTVLNIDDGQTLDTQGRFMIFMAATIASNIVLIFFVVVTCISVVWIRRCVRSRRKTGLREKQNIVEQGDVSSNYSWTPMVLNTAYRQVSDIVEPSLNQDVCLRKFNTDDCESQNEIYELIDSGYERIKDDTRKEHCGSLIECEAYARVDSISEAYKAAVSPSEENDYSTAECEVHCESNVNKECDMMLPRYETCESLKIFDCEGYVLIIPEPQEVTEDVCDDAEDTNAEITSEKIETIATVTKSFEDSDTTTNTVEKKETLTNIVHGHTILTESDLNSEEKMVNGVID